jgi:hypothetical protein
MARELEMEKIRERVSTIENCYNDHSEANLSLVNRNESHFRIFSTFLLALLPRLR